MNEAPAYRRGSHLTLTAWLVLALLPSAARAESIEEKAQVCAACHGENGVPVEQSFPVPVIWGQQLGYLFFELRDFKSGARKNDRNDADRARPRASGSDGAGAIFLEENLARPAAAGGAGGGRRRCAARQCVRRLHQLPSGRI